MRMDVLVVVCIDKSSYSPSVVLLLQRGETSVYNVVPMRYEVNRGGSAMCVSV
jgi:hypothetical protein